MTQTVDALQDKLDPDTLKHQAKTRAKDTVRTTGSQAAETVKQNPAIPLAVGGGMLALLLLRRLLGGGGSERVAVGLKKRRARRGWPQGVDPARRRSSSGRTVAAVRTFSCRRILCGEDQPRLSFGGNGGTCRSKRMAARRRAKAVETVRRAITGPSVPMLWSSTNTVAPATAAVA